MLVTVPKPPGSSRFEAVSRRAALKAVAGAGLAALIPGCGVDDEQVFAGAVATPPEPTTTTTEPPTTQAETTTTTEPTTTTPPTAAVDGALVVSFTYTQGVGGKNERPYIAVWIEDLEGELVQTVSVWFQQARRGERWLDHLDRWFATGAANDVATVSSATRSAGAHTVAWDGLAGGAVAPPGDYMVCIEAAREDGPVSLVCQPVTLTGSLEPIVLPDDGELSELSIRIDA